MGQRVLQTITDSQLASLPEPAQRYAKYMGVVDRPQELVFPVGFQRPFSHPAGSAMSRTSQLAFSVPGARDLGHEHGSRFSREVEPDATIVLSSSAWPRLVRAHSADESGPGKRQTSDTSWLRFDLGKAHLGEIKGGRSQALPGGAGLFRCRSQVQPPPP